MSQHVEDLRTHLLGVRNPDGGWGYYPGQHSRLEPTCWASLALATSGPGEPADPGITFLLGRQEPTGLLVDEADDRPNLGFNGLAALVLGQSDTPGSRAASAAIIDGLSSRVGVTLPPSPHSRQDNSLEGWPWIDGTFSWVEPTCWCLLSFKQATRLATETGRIRERIHSAEKLLFDRVCRGGGWNYGNANVLEQELSPYVPNTALGVLALQDRRGHEAVADSVEFLRRHWTAQPSGLALALTAIAFRILGLPCRDVDDLVIERWTWYRFFDNAHVTAMALYGLTGDTHGAAAFSLPG